MYHVTNTIPLVMIRKSRKGVEIGGGRLRCLTYADDIESREEIEEILQIANLYGKEWGLKLSESTFSVGDQQ